MISMILLVVIAAIIIVALSCLFDLLTFKVAYGPSQPSAEQPEDRFSLIDYIKSYLIGD